MQLFGTEIREAFTFVHAGFSVRIVGATGSGKSTIISRLINDLERSGHSVFAAKSLKSVQTPKYALIKALGLSSLPRDIDSRDEATVAASFVSELRNLTANVIVVDDIDDIDSMSLTVLNIVLERTGTPIVYSSTQPRGSGGPRSSDALHGLTRHATVSIPGLRYEAVNEYLHRMLGHTIETDVVMRVFGKSAGNPLLINVLAENAVRQERIQLRNGQWCLVAEDLWTEHLEPTCRALLKGVSRTQQKALHTLALLGPRPLTTVTKLIALNELEDLEDLGFIKLSGGLGDTPVVSVSPPIFGDYFKYRPATIRTVDVIETITSVLGAGEKELLGSRLSGYPSADFGTTDPVPSRNDSALSRTVVGRVSQSRTAHYERWSAVPTESNALLYLGEIGDSILCEATTDEVFHGSERSPTGTTLDHLQFGLLRAQWQAYHGGDIEGALDSLATLAEQTTPELRHHVEASAIGLEVMTSAVPTDIDERLARLANGPDPYRHVLTVESLVELVRGRPARARELLRSMPPSEARFLRHFGDVILAISHVSQGDFHTALELSLRMRTEARYANDNAGVYFNSYAAAVALVAQRRWDEAESLATSVLSLGRPSFMLGQIYDATLRIAAHVAAKRGKTDLCDSLTAEAARSRRLTGPLFAMDHGVCDVFTGVTAESQLEDYSALTQRVDDLERRGFLSQVVTVLLASLDVIPRPESVARLRALLPRLEMGAFIHDLDLVDGLFQARTVSEAGDVVTRFAPNGNEEFAAHAISSTASYFRAIAEGERATVIDNTHELLLSALSVQGKAVQGKAVQGKAVQGKAVQGKAVRAGVTTEHPDGDESARDRIGHDTTDPRLPALSDAMAGITGVTNRGPQSTATHGGLKQATVQGGVPSLSARELEIALLALKLDNQAIAERLGISVRAVENHMSRAYRKTGACSRSELFDSAYRLTQ